MSRFKEHIDISELSVNNSTASPLNTGQTWTGTAERTVVGAYTIPAGKKGYLLQAYMPVGRLNGSPTRAQLAILSREPGGTFTARRYPDATNSSPYNPPLGKSPIPFGSKFDVKARCVEVSDSNTSVSVDFTFLLVDEDE